MISGFVIMLRETLEAILIAGIIVSFLIKTKNSSYIRYVIHGFLSGVVLSIGLGIILNRLSGGFEGRSEEIFEGIIMLAGAILLTTMIVWMMNQSKIAQELENKTTKTIESGRPLVLFLVVFLAILREGVESVIFLTAARYAYSNPESVLTGAIIGILVAFLFGYIIFISSKKMKIKTFFTLSNIILIAFAAGLISHGIHELQEAGLFPQMVEHLWDINPSVIEQGKYPILHEKGYIGSVLAGLFGYNGNPSLFEVTGYLLYMGFIVYIWKRISLRRTN